MKAKPNKMETFLLIRSSTRINRSTNLSLTGCESCSLFRNQKQKRNAQGFMTPARFLDVLWVKKINRPCTGNFALDSVFGTFLKNSPTELDFAAGNTHFPGRRNGLIIVCSVMVAMAGKEKKRDFTKETLPVQVPFFMHKLA